MTKTLLVDEDGNVGYFNNGAFVTIYYNNCKIIRINNGNEVYKHKDDRYYTLNELFDRITELEKTIERLCNHL